MPLELTQEGKRLLERLRDSCKDLAKEFNIDITSISEPFYDQHRTGFQELNHVFNFLQANNKGLSAEEFNIATNIIQSSSIIDKKLQNIFIQKVNKDNFKELLTAWKKDKELPYNHLQIRAIIHVTNKLLDPKFLEGCANQSSTPEKKLLSQHFKLIDNDTKVPIPYLAGDFNIVKKLFGSVKNLPDSKTKLVKFTGNFVIAAVLDKKLPELINNLFNIIAGKQQLLAIYENWINNTIESNINISTQNQLKALIKKLSALAVNDKKFDTEYSLLANNIISYLDLHLKLSLWQNLKLNHNTLNDLEVKTGLSTTNIKPSLNIIKEILTEETILANKLNPDSNFKNQIKIYLNKKYINTAFKLNIAKTNLINKIDKYEGHKNKRALLQDFMLKINEIIFSNKDHTTEDMLNEEDIFILQKNILDILVLTQSYFIQMNEISKNIKELPGKAGSLIIDFLTDIMETTKIYTAEIPINDSMLNDNATNLSTQSNSKVSKEKISNNKNKLTFFETNNQEIDKKNKSKTKTKKNLPKATKPKQIIELLKMLKELSNNKAFLNTEEIIENFVVINRARELIQNISLNEIPIDKFLKKTNQLLTKDKQLTYRILDKNNYISLQQALEKIVIHQEDRLINILLDAVKKNSETNLKILSANIKTLIQKLPEESFEGSLHFTRAFCRNFNCSINKNLNIQAKSYEDLKRELTEIEKKTKSRANSNIIKRFFYTIKDIITAHTKDENNDIAKVKIQLKQL